VIRAQDRVAQLEQRIRSRDQVGTGIIVAGALPAVVASRDG
jgi:hypothetical protein